MSALAAVLKLKATPCAGSLRATSAAGRRGLLGFLVFLCMGTPGRGQVKAATEAAPLTEVEATVAYVSEVPWQWDAEQGNPLEKWARKLSSEWAKAPGDADHHQRNLRPELSWERLAMTARTQKAEAFVVHGYELIENGDAAQLDELLVPSRDRKAAVTEFVILRQRRTRAEGDERKFSMDDLWKKEILVDRGGCGELVYRWLDREIRPETGAIRRDRHADYRSASSAVHAVLAVYFGEVDACVVSRSSYSEVLRTNPKGLAARLEEARVSPPLLKHVIACPRSMSAKRRAEVVKSAEAIRVQLADGAWNLTVPKPDDFKDLRQLIREWEKFYGDGKEGNPENPPSTVPTPAVQTSAPGARISEGRLR